MLIPNCIKFDTMDKSHMEQLILEYTDTKEAITSESLWKKCGKPNKNNFYKILQELLQNEWIRRTKEGIVRKEFTKKDFVYRDNTFLKKWCNETRELIAKRHKPLFKTTKNGKKYLTKLAQEDLYQYFHEIDYHTLNILNRSFLAYRLKLITSQEYKKTNKTFEDLFDYMFNGLINDHKSFKKEITEHYLKSIHQTKFLV